jgi:hypothetical protein
MLYVINKNHTGFFCNCVFVISILHFPTTRMRTAATPTTSVIVYKTHPVCPHTLQPRRAAMEHRPNSHPERTGRYMTGFEHSIVKPRCVPDVLVEPCIERPSRCVDIGPDTSVQHLIRKRAQQLKEDRENLKLSLERYIQRRTIRVWTPPAHPSYNTFDARLTSFDSWTHREGVPSPESLAVAGFFYRGTYTHTLLQLTAVIPTHYHI